jgi:hypothetical protein
LIRNGKPDNSGNDVVIENTVNLKKSVGLISGTSLIVGTVIGEFLLCRGRRGPALQLSLQSVSVIHIAKIIFNNTRDVD